MALLSLQPAEPATLHSLPPTLDLEALRPHLVNLSNGQFSDDGALVTSAEDVDAIFAEHLPRYMDQHQGPLRLLFWAHGGLVSEARGIIGAARMLPHWLEHGIYPLFFIWETGLLDALCSLLPRSGARELQEQQQARARNLVEDLWAAGVERAVRPLGQKVWAQMKVGADQAVAVDGGAAYVAQRLAEFTARNPGAVQVHAAGHSAGAIFHSRFLPLYLQHGSGTGVSSLNLLAAALSIADFNRLLRPLVGSPQGIEHLHLFGLHRQLEEDDSVLWLYPRSLLCLISAALEPERGIGLLGLERSVAADADLAGFLGAPAADATWSKTEVGAPGRRCLASAHGTFDEDPATLNSVVYRVASG